MNALPMCCVKGKHGIVGLQRAVYDGVMATEAFASLAPEERPSVDRFTDKVKFLTDLAKVVFEIPPWTCCPRSHWPFQHWQAASE